MSNIKELAKYVAHHVNQRGKFYGKFPVSNGYIFTASEISSSHIYFHLEKDDHHQRIYVMLIQTPFRTSKIYLKMTLKLILKDSKSCTQIYNKTKRAIAIALFLFPQTTIPNL